MQTAPSQVHKDLDNESQGPKTLTRWENSRNTYKKLGQAFLTTANQQMHSHIPCVSNMRRTHTGSKTICGNVERVEAMMLSCYGTIEHPQISPVTFSVENLLSLLMCLNVCVR